MNKLLLLALFAAKSFAQYPFEKYPALANQSYPWKSRVVNDTTVEKKAAVPKFFKNGQALSIEIAAYDNSTPKVPSKITLRAGKQLLQVFDETSYLSMMAPKEKIFVADFNNDGLNDVKFYTPQMGNGLAAASNVVVYLLQNKDMTFSKITFLDMFDGAYRPERDLGNDGKYCLITMDFEEYQKHNYRTFNVFTFEGNTLVNANSKHGYPMMFQYLTKPNYRVDTTVSATALQQFSKRYPPGYKTDTSRKKK